MLVRIINISLNIIGHTNSYSLKHIHSFTHTHTQIYTLSYTRNVCSTVVHGASQPDLEVLVEELAAEGHPPEEHVHGHEAQGLAVHEEAVGGHAGQVVHHGHVVEPGGDVGTRPTPRIFGQVGLREGREARLPLPGPELRLDTHL